MGDKKFRSDLELTKEKIEQFFPDSNNRLSIEKILRDCIKLASQLNNSNWNVNFDGSFIRFNCGARYVLNINSSRIRVMCLRESFLNLGKEFITEFILTHTLYLEDSSKLLGVKIPRNYEEFIAIPTENLWHNSVQFEIPIDEWTTNYSKILTPSILDFAKDCINQSSIMTQMKTAHSPAIIELINEDLNEELIQPSYPKDEKTQFTWIPFYKEMAKKLLEYKDRRSELIQILYSSLKESNLSSTMYVDDGPNNVTIPLTNIDPFTFMGSFNRGNKWQDRVKLANSIASALTIELRLSDDEDFKSIPILNSQHSTLFFRNCPQEDYDKLWNLFEKAYLYTKENQQDFAASFDVALTVKGTGQKYATMASYWVNPYKILAVDENNVELLNSYGVKVSNQLTGNDYLEILNKTTSMIESREIKEKSIPEFSYKAWLTKKEDYWACGFNFGASNNQYKRFIENNIWEGRFDSEKDDKQIKKVESVRPGNVLILKTTYTKGSNHSIPATKIYAVGIVSAISEPKDIGQNYLSYVFNVDYREVNPPYELDIAPYRDTISLVRNDELKTFAKNLLGEFSMADINVKSKSTLTEKSIALLKSNHNIILHGAPGTGKTYLAKEIAKAMGCTDNEIGFVQFHPSYDYTDFVEGLRPVNSEDGNSIGFERKDGVFKEFCEKAIKATKDPEIIDNFDESWKKLVDKLDEVGVIDIPLLSGRGTFPIELNEYGTGLASRTYQTEKRDEWISGKSKFFSKEQLNNIYKGLPGVPAEGHDNYRKAVVKYMKENFQLKEFSLTSNSNKKANTQTKPFVFIIDEINRGEMSKIFGELFFSIDPSYRGFDDDGKPKGLVQTQYQNLVTDGEFVNGFYVPENVYIIGTMNDIDRSVESMDFAMRRRFIFKEITAAESAVNMELSEEATRRMTNLNNAISSIEGLNLSYHIGGAYFQKEVEIDGEMKRVSVESGDFTDLWELKLEPLLKEYLRGMEGADEKLGMLKTMYEKSDVEESEDM